MPASRRTVGPTGLSVMLDDADLSVRDLAFWMMCVSDNTATDVLMERLGGPARINATLRSLGLVETHLIGDCKVLLDGLMVELGIGPDLTIDDVTEGQLRGAVALQPEGTNHSTARDVTSLLSMIWRDEAAPPDACAEVRRIMALQVWPHRLTAGFDDGIRISAKTGTLPGIRNEAGVVEPPTAAATRSPSSPAPARSPSANPPSTPPSAPPPASPSTRCLARSSRVCGAWLRSADLPACSQEALAGFCFKGGLPTFRAVKTPLRRLRRP